MRRFFVGELGDLEKEDREKLKQGITPTQIAYIAAGLAEWDKHVAKKRSPETDAALRLMFAVQGDDGSFSNEDCWPPLESSHYHGATVAAMAVAAAPGWVEAVMAKDLELTSRYDRLMRYLRETKPPHDYGRLLLLWASTGLPNLIDAARKDSIMRSIWSHQQSDGGWSLRSFATPETWGSGNRAEKLRAEPELDAPLSDGHMTGLAVLVLRKSGVPKTDPRIEKAVQWIKSNQRESGRWWTRSLNTDKYHFITYSGSCYPLLALAQCDALR
jgi:squalene-hopene/tetraprenyl-beta-curcumene cyclase